ncbi:DegT/DnrJ/EryC1/StrS family aminotransferase [Gemmatimonadota bacterium]
MTDVPYVNLPAQHRPLEEELLEAVRGVLRHGAFILGPEVAELESRLAQLLHVPHVVTVASGTDALTMALRLRGIGPGHEVLVPSHSFLATGQAVALVGAEPVFLDIEPARMLMEPAHLHPSLCPRTRAVIPVHLGGHPCDMEAISTFASEHGLELIEDCAQAMGTRAYGRSVGDFGLGCFSLHPLKTLSALGDAGFITVHREEDAERLRLMRNFGLVDRDHTAFVAGHSRLDTIQAAMLLVKLRYLDSYLEARRAHAAAYSSALEGAFRLVEVPDWAEPSHSTFVIRHPERDRIVAAMGERGFDVKIHYPVPIHMQAPYAQRREWHLPETDRAVGEIMSLPVTPELPASDRHRIIEALLEVARV